MSVEGMFGLSLLLVLGGCAASPSDIQEVSLGREFTLRAGEQARVSGEDLVVTFSDVPEDSRCPRGAQCIVAGYAVVTGWVRQGDHERTDFALRTDRIDDAMVSHHGYTIRLVRLDPYPSVNQTIRPEDYRAIFVASSVPPPSASQD